MQYPVAVAALLSMALAPEVAAACAQLIRETAIDLDMSGVSLACLVDQMRADKKNSGETISFILPTGPGKVTEMQCTAPETEALLARLARWK